MNLEQQLKFIIGEYVLQVLKLQAAYEAAQKRITELEAQIPAKVKPKAKE